MSIESMTSRDLVEIRREFTPGGSGEAIKEWTTDARGALPALDVPCRIQEMDGEECTTYGVRSGMRAWKLYFGVSGNPSITTLDRLYFSDEGSEDVNETLVIRPSKSFDHQNRLWKCIVEQLGYAEEEI
jgi:hypothetical protein